MRAGKTLPKIQDKENIMLKNIAFLLSIGAITLPSTVQAVELNKDFNLDFSVGVYSHYESESVDQSDSKPVIQTALNLSHTSGFNLFGQVSNFDIETAAKYEIFYALGYYHPFNDNIYLYSYIGQIKYPNYSILNVTEGYLKGSAYGAYFEYAYDWGKISNIQYRHLGYKYDFPKDVWLDIRLGNNDLGYDLVNNSGGSRQTYNLRRVELGKKYKGIDYTLTYSDTDMDETECTYAIGLKDKCDAAVAFGIKKTF